VLVSDKKIRSPCRSSHDKSTELGGLNTLRQSCTKPGKWITLLGAIVLSLALPSIHRSQARIGSCISDSTKTCPICFSRNTKFLPGLKAQATNSSFQSEKAANSLWFFPSPPADSHRKKSALCYSNRFVPDTGEEEQFTIDRVEPLIVKPNLRVIADQTQVQPQTGSEAHELAKKLSNPVASLISVPFQSNFDFGMGAGSGWRYTLNIQPVIPVALSPEWNLISRTILPIIHQEKVAGTGSQSGLGDITQSFFFSPAKSRRFIWGVGPVLLIPAATNDFLGTKKFGLGPTVLVLKQQDKWTYGVLANHIWSVAGSDSRASVNSTFIQPFLAYNTKDAWTFNVNTESSYDWTGNAWSIPIHFTITKLIKVGQRPVSIGGAIRCWAASPEGGPENCGLRIIVTPLFPR